MSVARPKRAMETDPSVSSELSDQVDAVFAELEKTQVSSERVSSVTVEKVIVEKVSVPSVSVESVSVASASVQRASVESVFVPSFKVAQEPASDSAGSSSTISNTSISSRPGKIDPKTRARQLQLRLALTARADGRMATAVGSLFDFARMYPGTQEALEALDNIAEIALEHEEAGRTRIALDLYERLGTFED
jgi:hypothetical protein